MATWTPTAGQIPPESVWTADGHTRICRLSDRYDDGAADDATIMKHARLIAAAPELLAELQRAVDCLEEHAKILERTGGGIFLREAASRAKAVIDRAKSK